MDITVLSVLTYALIGLGVWAGIVAFTVFTNIVRTYSTHKCRRSDVYQFIFLFVAAVLAFVVVFIHPGLIYQIPSTVATLEIGSIPILMYLTEKHTKDWVHLQRQRNRQQNAS